MRIDSHVHTKNFSCDSDLIIENVLKKLEKDQFITITEHAEHEDYLPEGDFIFDKEEYFKKYATLRENENVYLGVELGLNLNRKDDILEFYDKRFDYVLASTHTLYGKDIFHEKSVYDAGKIKVYNDYFNQTIMLLNNYSFCNAFAHFDYITRYNNYPDPVIRLNEFEDKLVELFTCLKNNNVLLELNTKSQTDFNELRKLLKLYKEIGNDYVVIGSDSHDDQSVFNKFDIYQDLIKSVGLKQAYFIEQKLVIVE